MAARVLAFDWSTTPLGPIEAWPHSLKASVGTCLHSGFQMAIYWGPELHCIYNDAERDILGKLHPSALGMPARELLHDSWDVVGPQLHAVMRGEGATWAQDRALTFDRHGAREVGYFTYSYSPIVDDLGDVGGVLLVSQDTTARVLAERRLEALRELATASMDARDEREACELAARCFERRADVVAFVLIYLVEKDGKGAVCTARSGRSGDLEASQMRVPLDGFEPGLARVFHRLVAQRPSGMLVNTDLFTAPTGGRPSPKRCFASTISRSWTDPVTGFFVAGIEAESAFDSPYRSFLEMVVLAVGRSIAATRAREAERERARSIAALDRAKTELFSSASHELRTPLALILGPLDQLLDDAGLPASTREPIGIARRNAARMLKLVDALLDFSLIEAGERASAFESTDLAELTRGIAAMFRSTAERAALRLSVDCPPLPDRAYVDREAWERIVSNLLSNALKFTPQGEIDVRLCVEQGHFVLTVEDTGIGVAGEDLVKIFSRFYRGSDPRARSHEGSGIGLAMVRELVRLHGGTIAAQRRAGRGTRIVVRIPAGCGHLSSHMITDASPGAASGPRTAQLVNEASGWLSSDDLEPRRSHSGDQLVHRPARDVPGEVEHVDRVLVVEDNSDMRDYLRRLLTPYYALDVVSDGSEAFELAVRNPPSVVITDAMMPGLDGFGFVRAIRRDARTRDIPIMLISGRADPESRLRALDLGADEYIVKPFNAREVVARLRAMLDSSRLRREDAEARGQERERALGEDQLRALLGDLRTAQRRVAAAADAERRRIERNLHDGAQQRLMAIRLELGMVGELFETDSVAAQAELVRLHAELNEALDELRELAHGLYPPLLASDGLHAALSAAALRAALPVTIEGNDISRMPRTVESAAYFACLEALQNAAKHAGDGARATVQLDLSRDELTFSVRDDGAGFDVYAASRGQGLTNLRDRLGALGGSAEITSAPGRGTTILGRIPLP